MVSSAGGEAPPSQPEPALSEQLARRILRPAAPEHLAPEALAVVAARVYTRLRTHLAVFLGEQGFDALWRRAIHLARKEFLAWDSAVDDQESPMPPGLHSALHGANGAEAETRLLAAFASFIDLLFTFIGESLGVRLLDQAWPDLPPGASGAPAEGTAE